jgi:hypothetical protein
LPAGAVVRYERISTGKGTGTNGSITVTTKGEVVADGPAYGGRRGLGGLRRRHPLRLGEAEMTELRERVAALDGAPPYQRDEVAKGGDWEVVTRGDGEPASVVFENAEREVLESLRSLARRAHEDR